MQEVIILRGGVHFYSTPQGPRDCYYVDPGDNVKHLKECFTGGPISNLGHFPGVDASLIVRDVKVSDNNVVAWVSEPDMFMPHDPCDCGECWLCALQRERAMEANADWQAEQLL